MMTKRVRVSEVGWRAGLLAGAGLLLGCGSSSETTGADQPQPVAATAGSGGATSGTGASGGDGVDITGPGVGGGGGSGASGCGPVVTECDSSGTCSDGDPCTDDVCVPSGEFLACESTPIPDCTGDPTAPIDSSCDDVVGGDPVADSVWVPYQPLQTPSLPAACNVGFEWQNCQGSYEVTATDACGAEAQTLYIDIATYTYGDRLRITALDADDQPYLLLDTCRIRTYDKIDPTDGTTRPPDQTIRQFTLAVKAGTKSIHFDSTPTTTPWYMRVLGLCGFDALDSMATCAWRSTSL